MVAVTTEKPANLSCLMVVVNCQSDVELCVMLLADCTLLFLPRKQLVILLKGYAVQALETVCSLLIWVTFH